MVDPITVEVVRHALIAAAEEMKTNLRRTAYNPIIYEVLDFSCGVLDRNTRMVAQSDGLPIFLGNLTATVSTMVADVGVDRLRPGDVYLMNDPYEAGNHLNDVATIAPVFSDGDELLGFACTRAHWLDIGGKDPAGSLDATEIMQEGLWFRSVLLQRAGEPVPAVYRMIEHNIRYARNMLGDLRAQVAATHVGAQRVREIFARHGTSVVEQAIASMHQQGDQRTRDAIRLMPDGVYEAETCMDDDCRGNGPLPVKVTATVEGSDLTIDLAGSHGQNVGPVNAGLPATEAACKIALKALTHPRTPTTDGDFEALRVLCPEDSMFNAQFPAPTFMYTTHLITLTDLVIRALSGATPRMAVAGHYGHLCGFFFVGFEPTDGELYIHQEPEHGGWGAGPHGDGESAMISIANGDTQNLPAEIIEARFPLRVERHALRPDTGGPGMYRGGLGTYRDYRVLGHNPEMTSVIDRRTCPPWGLQGGGSGSPARVMVDAEGAAPAEYGNGRRVRVGADQVVSVQTPGGGGWGSPLARDPEQVRLDVERGYVTSAAARLHYGVVVDEVGEFLDADATARVREDLSRDEGVTTP
ncbi:hydantoinase B/oxoprolinase family protein [Egibacter rhizosphaerae]|nr:hydantoinase B/oxoprolinase family protein [Egibacter rhizosphaerae]